MLKKVYYLNLIKINNITITNYHTKMSFKRQNKKALNIFFVLLVTLLVGTYFFSESLENKVYIEKVTKGYDLNVKF